MSPGSSKGAKMLGLASREFDPFFISCSTIEELDLRASDLGTIDRHLAMVTGDLGMAVEDPSNSNGISIMVVRDSSTSIRVSTLWTQLRQ